MRILSREDVRQAVSMAEAIEAVKVAYAQLSAGQATVPLRTPIDLPAHAGITLFMPAYLASSDALGAKVVSVHDRNPEQGLPLIHALVLLIDPTTGQPLAAMEGGYLTALRTGAASGVATHYLARPNARIVACFGAGTQAETQLEAVCAVRDISRAWVVDPNGDKARQFCQKLAGRGRIPTDLRLADSPAQAVRDADVVVCATTSTTPVFDGQDLQPGTHVNAIGAYRPDMQEVDATTILRATVVVDQRQACLAEAGDLILPLKQGLITGDKIYAEIGEIVLGRKLARSDSQEITYFKSVGNAVQDVAVGQLALHKAEQLGLGVEVGL
jgi:ornithine cyclodeaminase/alanine dehydrogenase-like protein (mu-crystallin family)